jgi:hypothetical protein
MTLGLHKLHPARDAQVNALLLKNTARFPEDAPQCLDLPGRHGDHVFA